MIRNIPSLLCAVAMLAALPGASVAQDIGRASFMANCAVCHGPDGTGNGPILDMLKSAPSDLTGLAARNGGRFPIEQTYAVIANADEVGGHGTTEMPIWGNRFNAEVIAQEGEYGDGTSGVPTAQARILELVYYLATIQKEE